MPAEMVVTEVPGWLGRAYWLGVAMGGLVGLCGGYILGQYKGYKRALRGLMVACEDITESMEDKNG